MKERIVRASLAIVALGLLTYGSWKAWEPLGYIVPGALLWFDLFVETLRGRR